MIAYFNWRISWRNIFAMLVKLDTKKLEFRIRNPYGKSVVLEVERKGVCATVITNTCGDVAYHALFGIVNARA